MAVKNLSLGLIAQAYDYLAFAFQPGARLGFDQWVEGFQHAKPFEQENDRCVLRGAYSMAIAQNLIQLASEIPADALEMIESAWQESKTRAIDVLS